MARPLSFDKKLSRPLLPPETWRSEIKALNLAGVYKRRQASSGATRLAVQFDLILELINCFPYRKHFRRSVKELVRKHYSNHLRFNEWTRRQFSWQLRQLIGKFAKTNLKYSFGFYKGGSLLGAYASGLIGDQKSSVKIQEKHLFLKNNYRNRNIAMTNYLMGSD